MRLIYVWMSLNSDQLDAFEAVARLGSFTAAASKLHLTQPALSRRIQSLEEHLNAALFFRKPSGIELTGAGFRLLRFVESKGLLESELTSDLSQGESAEPMGRVRIAGYTSVLHTAITPSIGAFLRQHPKVSVHYQATQDIRPFERQIDLLMKAEIDLLVTVTDLSNRDLTSHFVGNQELIAVESTIHPARPNVYLDTRPEDVTTARFFKSQSGRAPQYERSFLYDEDGILRAVMEGLGRAVVFRSLIKKGMPVRPVRGMKPMVWPTYLAYRKQYHYLPAMAGIRDAILASAARHLN